MKISLSMKSLRFLLNRNLCFLSKQGSTKPAGGRCISSSSVRQKSTVCFKHLQNTLREPETLLGDLAVRKFSLSKTVSSNRGSNRNEEKRQVRILYISLGVAVLFCVYAMFVMEHHQDFVIIEPDDRK